MLKKILGTSFLALLCSASYAQPAEIKGDHAFIIANDSAANIDVSVNAVDSDTFSHVSSRKIGIFPGSFFATACAKVPTACPIVVYVNGTTTKITTIMWDVTKGTLTVGPTATGYTVYQNTWDVILRS